jgi:predicted Zn-dependent protease
MEADGGAATYHNQPVGNSAVDLLTSATFSSLKVDVVYVEGQEPTAATLTNLKTFLEKRLNKPQGITIRKTAIASPKLAPYSIKDIQQVEQDFRSLRNQGNSLAVFVFVADGGYADSENVLGVAYQNTSVALFGSKIDQYSGGIGQPSQTLLETTVMNHEFGHIMGLVNIGVPPQTDHQDTAHGRHCDVESCLMYWTAETGDAVSNLVGLSQAPDLDPQCIADLQAKGGK